MSQTPTGATGPELDAPKASGSYPEPPLPELGRYLYRFLLGRPMDNRIRTDATFFQSATKGYPSRWLRMAGWKRVAIRLLALYVIAWALVSLAAWGVAALAVRFGWTPPAWTSALSWANILQVHLLAVLAVLVPVGIRRRVRDYGFRVLVPALELQRVPELVPVRVHIAAWVPYEVQGRKVWDLEKVQPVALAAARVLSISARPEKAGTWVTVPRNYRDPEGDPVEVLLPADFTGADKGTQDRLVRAVAARLGLKDPVASFHLAGQVPRLELAAPPTPPEMVTFDMVRDLLMGADEYRPLLGMSGTAAGVFAEMIEDSPHIALSAGPGAGKSTLAKLVAIQALRWGWGVVIIDWKMSRAFDWAKDLPGVTYITELEAIHDFGVRIHQEVDIRKANGLGGRAKVLVIRDEWNVTADLLMGFWSDLRSTAEPEERKTMPTKSPALRGYSVLDYAGREYGLHDFVIAQRLSARVFNGNTDIRECFGIRGLARFTPQTKKILVGDIRPFPRKSNTPGRWVFVMGEEVVEVQVPYITSEEAREFAMGGAPNPSSPLTSSYYPTMTQRADGDSGLGESLGLDPTRELAGSAVLEGEEVPAVDSRKLSEMVDGLAHLGITEDVLKNERKRDPAFPQPISGSPNRGWKYDYLAVSEWARRRHAALHAEKAEKR
jgi:hypothetical protein